MSERSRQERQIPLALAPVERLTEEAFVVGAANRAAVELVARWPQWPSGVLVLVGPPGAGKTHLASIWQARAGAQRLPAMALDAVDPLALSVSPVVVEDIDASGVGERALFHLLNAVGERGTSVLLTARTPPAALPLALPDLASRLRAALTAVLGPPDDVLLEKVLTKLFADRQLVVDPEVVRYLARRMERSYDAAGRVVEELDRAALSAQRPVTRALAARLLGSDNEDEPPLPGLAD